MNSHFVNMTLLLLAGLCTVSSLFAETYTWIDAQGTVNFTENYSNIPEKYRKKVRMRENIEYGKPPTQSAMPAGKDGDTVIKDQPEKQIMVVPNQFINEPQEMYAGKRGEEWAREFKNRNSEISLLEQRIRETEELLKKPVGLNKDQIYKLPQEVVSLITQRNDAIKRYNELNDAANTAGVPAEYRK